MNKLKEAARRTGITEIAIAGGVSANSGLRNAFESTGKSLGWNTFIPAFQYCTDNAGMIGVAAHYKYLDSDYSDLSLVPNARLKM